MPVINIKSSDQYRDAITSDGLSAIEFCAPWDAPSKLISPHFDTYAKSDRFKPVKFYRVDICESQDVAMDSGVKLAPTYHFYKDGVKVSDYIGSSYPALERSIAAHLHSA